jgi:hypothetical protein
MVRVSHSFFEKRDRVRELITQGPSAAVAPELWHLIGDKDVRRVFFGLLADDPTWIPVLRRRGYFRLPPKAEALPDGQSRHPQWPASQYLARVAPAAPREVAAVLANIDTDNASVIGDMLNAANAMPPGVASALVPAVCRAVRAGTALLRLRDAGDLCLRLVEGKQTDAAMDLAVALFTPRFGRGETEPRDRDAYWYRKGLAKVAPAFARLDAARFLPMLCDWLETTVKATTRVKATTGADDSYLWRPAIEEHEQNRDYDFAGVLVGITRNAFEEAIASGAIAPDEAMAIVERHPLLVFRRLRIHLLAEYAERMPEAARATMLRRSLFDDYEYRHEYARLMCRRFDMLSAEEQDQWFAWVDAGPDLEGFDDQVRRHAGRDATDEDRTARIRWWQYEKLHWVRNHLGGERKTFYQQMHAEHGEPELADLVFRVGTARWGSQSLRTVEELAALGFSEAISAVTSWRPTGSGVTGPTIEGLASTFGQYVARDRSRFSRDANALRQKPAIFVRTFLGEMAAGARAGEAIDVRAVVELCQWVVDRPIEEQTVTVPGDASEVDRDWQWTRNEVARFIEQTCMARSGPNATYPVDGLREPMWRLLDVLCRAGAESSVVRDMSDEDPRVRDYLDVGINSPRGKAVEAALEYARWVGSHVKQSDGDQEVVPGGWDSMPEVREMLAWQIARDNRTVAAMSVIASMMGLLYWIDKEWLAGQATAIFTLKDPPGWAAWNAFLVWVRPHVAYYGLLKAQFARAAREAEDVALPDRSREQPMCHLGNHLVILYGRGQLGLDDDGGLLRRFIEKAHPDVRRHTMGYIGTSLQGDAEIPEDVLQRFMALWEVYWSGVGQTDAKEKPDSLLFGPWFVCAKFPALWAIEKLREFVEIAPAPEPDDLVMERLAQTADQDISLATQVLDRMVHGDTEGWRVSMWTEPARAILSLAMQAGGQVRYEAEALINHLGRRGYVEFGDLLPRPQ